MASRRPWYKWYPGDFASSPRVRLLTLEQEACFRRLLDIQWQSADCTIPDDMRTLCVWTANAFQNSCDSDAVLQFFPLISAGKRANERLYSQYLETISKSEKAQLSAKTRWNTKETAENANAMRTHKNASKTHRKNNATQTQTQTQNNTPIIPKEMHGFEIFWKAYPRKAGKGKAEDSWKKLKPTPELQSRILKSVQAQSKTEQWVKDNGQFIPHPATWLNQRRWEDSASVEIPNDNFVLPFADIPDFGEETQEQYMRRNGITE